jgi:hypothetical protein
MDTCLVFAFQVDIEIWAHDPIAATFLCNYGEETIYYDRRRLDGSAVSLAAAISSVICHILAFRARPMWLIFRDNPSVLALLFQLGVSIFQISIVLDVNVQIFE